MQEVYDFLTSAGIYHIATVDAEGKPHNRPFGSKLLFEGKFYISTNPGKAVDDQLRDGQFFEISAMGKGRDWVRISGKAIFVTDPELKQKIFDSRSGGPARPIENVSFYELTEVTAQIISGEEIKTYNW